jgi:hypothetical protein
MAKLLEKNLIQLEHKFYKYNLILLLLINQNRLLLLKIRKINNKKRLK